MQIGDHFLNLEGLHAAYHRREDGALLVDIGPTHYTFRGEEAAALLAYLDAAKVYDLVAWYRLRLADDAAERARQERANRQREQLAACEANPAGHRWMHRGGRDIDGLPYAPRCVACGVTSDDDNLGRTIRAYGGSEVRP